MSDPAPLLVVDSGIGGLSVVAALREVLPGRDITYLADTAGFPYGDLTDDALARRLLALLDAAVAALSPRLLVIACNTASTVALAALRAHLPLPVVGCVPPIKPAAALSRSRRIGLLATPATVRRDYVRDLMARHGGNCVLHSWGSPHLAALAEAAFLGEAPDEEILAGEVGGLMDQPGAGEIDAVALGCTHYAFLLPWLRRLAPAVTHWLDPAPGVARRVAGLLDGEPGGRGEEIAYVTAPLSPAVREPLGRHGFSRLEMAPFAWG